MEVSLLTNVTDKTVDISEYVDFGFNGKFWFKDNYDISPSDPGRWLRVITPYMEVYVL